MKALSQKDDASMIAHEVVLVEQLKSKPGGQLVEVTGTHADKTINIMLCEMPSE